MTDFFRNKAILKGSRQSFGAPHTSKRTKNSVSGLRKRQRNRKKQLTLEKELRERAKLKKVELARIEQEPNYGIF